MFDFHHLYTDDAHSRVRRLLKAGIALPVLMLAAQPALADSGQNASNAAAGSAEASAELVAAGGQVALGAVAVPLAVAGGALWFAGEGALEIGSAAWEAANAPLEVCDEVIMAVPPPKLAPAHPQIKSEAR